jgi:DNA polymerase III epsilon subunit-like protein
MINDQDAKKMALIDLEWTPGSIEHEYYLIEIAVIILQSSANGWMEIESYETLVNPDIPLCPRVQALTGITPSMCQNSPRLIETIEHLDRLTKGCTLVAHGAAKDQQVLEAALERIGHRMPRHWLCTLERARHEWSDLNQYDLASLSSLTGHKARREHRAMEDARALKHIFLRLVRAPKIWQEWKKCDLLDHMPELQSRDYKRLEDIPQLSGTFSFYQSKKLLYLGAALNLRDEIERLAPLTSHLAIDDIVIEVQEHELINIVMTHSLSARFNPGLNKTLEKKFIWGLFSYRDQSGVMRLKLRKCDQQKRFPLEVFATKSQGVSKLAELNKIFFEKNNTQFKSPSEILHLNLKREKEIDRLSLPFTNVKISLKRNEDEWLLVQNGRLVRYKRNGKETTIRETLSMRIEFMKRYREIKTRLDHPYVFYNAQSTSLSSCRLCWFAHRW